MLAFATSLLKLGSLDVVAARSRLHHARIVRPEGERRGCLHIPIHGVRRSLITLFCVGSFGAARQSRWESVLPHPSMFPDVDAIASLECSGRLIRMLPDIQLVDPLGTSIVEVTGCEA
jgi:hypothetical protein